MLSSSILVVAIVVIGVGLTTWMTDRLRFEERVAIGAVGGALVTSTTTLIAFTAVGMGWGALGIGLALPGVAAGVGIRRSAEQLGREGRSMWRRLKLPTRRPASLRPFMFFSVASAAVTTRVLSLSYQTTADGVSAGSLAVWGDWSAHLAYAGSFAYGDNRGFDLPIASGHGFRYHFLSDFFGAMFTVSGANLQQGLVISEWLIAVAFAPLLWCAATRLTRSRSTAALTLCLFTLSGGLGLWYFAQDVERSGWSIITALPRTYARIPDEHIWLDNTISASLYAQRSTLLGLSVGLAALILVLVSRPSWSKRGLASAGILIGLLGLAHAHTLLTAIALGAMAAVADRRREWLWFLAPAAILGLPVAAMLLPETSAIRWMVGWSAVAADQPWPWFWLRNVGLLLPLFAWLTLMGGAPGRLRRLTLPLWLWFLVPNLIAFHPWEGNNSKYFMFWQLAGSLLVASWISRLWSRSSSSSSPSSYPLETARQVAIAFMVLVMVSAGSLDTIRAMQRSAAIPWVTNDDLAAAAWLRDNTEPDDVIVYGMTNTSAVAALGGRRVVSGFIGWTYDLGLDDWLERSTASETILTGGSEASAAVDRYGVDFVAVGPNERGDLRASDAYWQQHGTQVFVSGEYAIYATG